MKVVIALGGNALLKRGEPMEQSVQRLNIEVAARLIARACVKHRVIITHGNGPQVGLLALQNDAFKEVSPYSLDVLGAESEGMIGYMLAQGLRNHSSSEVIAILTQTLVDPEDAAFEHPTKFVGPVYDEVAADQLRNQKGWRICLDGDMYRRVVPSPNPIAIVEHAIIERLYDMPDVILVCTGGGGVPVVKDPTNAIGGVEAVVDKDLASNVLAQSVGAEGLIMLSDVECVETHFKQPHSRNIRSATPEQISEYAFAAGSMGPKVDAACDFVRKGGVFAAIGALNDLNSILDGKKGTFIQSSDGPMEFY